MDKTASTVKQKRDIEKKVKKDSCEKFMNEAQRQKIKELWDNKEDEAWETL